MKVDISYYEGSPQMNVLLIQTPLRGIMEGKYYRFLDLLFRSFFANSDTGMGHKDEAPQL